MNFKTIDFELTSACNAACPLCPRTHFQDKILKDFIDKDIVKNVVNLLNDKYWWFNFKGDLGDCIVHKDILEIIENIYYLRKDRGGFELELYTNGGVRSTSFWKQLGELSYDINNTKDCGLKTYFAIDGLEDTNHIYRVNVKYDKLISNVKNYIKNGGRAGWKYIVFNHNEHQIDTARQLSIDLGFESFSKRKSWRNIQTHTNTQNKYKQSKKFTYDQKSIDKHIDNLKVSKSKEAEFDFTNQIQCFYLHEGSIFIGSDATVWPCCQFYDSYRKNETSFMNTLVEYPSNFNSLKYHNLEDILNTTFFKTLEKRWNKNNHNTLFSKECVKFCSQKGAMAPKDEIEQLI